MAFVPALPAGHCWRIHLCSKGCEACSSGRALCWQQSHTGQGCGCQLQIARDCYNSNVAMSAFKTSIGIPLAVAGAECWLVGLCPWRALSHFAFSANGCGFQNSWACSLVPVSNFKQLRICKLFYLNRRHEDLLTAFFLSLSKVVVLSIGLFNPNEDLLEVRTETYRRRGKMEMEWWRSLSVKSFPQVGIWKSKPPVVGYGRAYCCSTWWFFQKTRSRLCWQGPAPALERSKE